MSDLSDFNLYQAINSVKYTIQMKVEVFGLHEMSDFAKVTN